MAVASQPPRLPERVLVTGATGFIGSHLVARLNALGVQVGALSRTAPRWPPVVGVTQICSDLADAGPAIAAITAFAPEGLVHLASLPDATEDFRQVECAIGTNLMATAAALEGARMTGCRAFVYADSTKVYGNGPLPHRAADPIQPTGSYAIAKAAGWELCRMYERLHGLPVVSVRPTLIFGPGQRRNLFSVVIEKVLAGDRDVSLDGGDQTRDPLYIDDAVDALVLALIKASALQGRVVCLGGGEERTIARLAQRTVELMGSDLRILTRPGRERPTEIWRSYCDNREAFDALGWSPRTPFDEALRRTIAAAAPNRNRATVLG